MKAILFSALALVLGIGTGWVLRGTSSPMLTESVPTKSERVLKDKDDILKERKEGAALVESNLVTIAGINVSPENLASLGEQFRKTNNPIERSKIFNELLSLMTKDNALTIRALVKDLNNNSPEFRNFHFAWGALAEKEAMDFGLESREYDGGIILQGWASANPDIASEWYKNIDYENNPAFEKMRERGLSVERIKGYLQQELVKGLYSADPEKAASYLSSLEGSDTDLARRSSEELVEDIIARNGVEAAKDWVELLPSESFTSRAIGEIADEWSEQDSGAALEWAMTHGDDTVRRSALENVWRNIAQGEGGADPYTAAEQINAMEASPDKDSALMGYASGSRRLYPETAVEAALSINDPNLRTQSLISSASSYLRANPEEANAWLNNSGIDQDTISKIRRRSKKR